jgi:hypothetical protein
VRDLV